MLMQGSLKSCCVAFLVGTGAMLPWARAAEAEGTLPTKTLELYRVASPPRLDGVMDDICWQSATATGDFELYKSGGMPRNRTQAWGAYDARNLYLFFECRDRDMAGVAGKRPQDKIDEDIWQEEEIELFFDVNQDRKTYFQLMCSVLGTKYDMASQVGKGWHGDRDRPGQGWLARTRRDTKAWYAEIAIPFIAFRRTSEFVSTPQPGTSWGANFYRHEYRENEWINWNVATRGFHQPERFGRLLFMGFRGRQAPHVEDLDVPELEFGVRSVSCRVVNPMPEPSAVSITVNVLRNSEPSTPLQRDLQIAARGEQPATFPYRITEGGKWQSEVIVRCGDDILLVGLSRRRLPSIRQNLATLLATARTGLDALRGSGFPAAEKNRLSSRLKDLAREGAEFAKTLTRADDLTGEQWDAVRLGIIDLEERSRDTVRQLAYVSADREQGGAGSRRGFLVDLHGSLVHVFPDTTGGRNPEGGVRLAAMRGEGESFQVAVMALWEDLRQVEVSAGPLSGPGEISGNDVTVFLEAYQKSARRPSDPPRTREWFPDVLLDNVPRDVPAYMTQPFWIDINVPRTARPGLYRGKVTVAVVGKNSQSIPVTLTVRDCGLPQVSSLRNDFWITTHGPRWWKHDTRSVAGMEGIMRIAARNRISAMPSFWIELYAMVKITCVEPEKYTFDFAEFNRFLLVAKRYGVSSWNPNLECNQGWASYFCGSYGAVRILDAASGEEWEFANRYKKKTIPLDEIWMKTPLFEQFWKAYVKNLKSVGMLEMAWYESVDEPNDTPRIELLLQIHGQLRKWVPELKLMSWGTYPAHHYARGRGWVDAWAPQLGWYPEVREIMQRDQRENGIAQHVYTCGSQARNDKGGFTPDGYVRDPNISRRMIPWMCWKWDIRAYLFYAMNVWPQLPTQKDSVIRPEDQPWPTVTQVQKQPVFNIVMPGPNKTFLPTIRLKAFRDGMDDYDYLKILQALAARLDGKPGSADLREQAKRALVVDDQIVADPFTYTLLPAVLDERRQLVGDLIEKISRVLGQ